MKTWLPWAALLLEPCGVFLLSVEAIKLRNLRSVNERLRQFYSFVNPRIDFVDSEEEARTEPPHPLYGRSSVTLWSILVVVFVATPLVLVLSPSIGVLTKVEQHTRTGTIGILGFVLWFASFIINHALHI